MSDGANALAKVRLAACKRWPYASSAILSMVPVERPGFGTLAVDKHWRIYYDPAVLQTWSPETAVGVVLHEVKHLLLRHHRRAKAVCGDDASLFEVWNYATDAAINSELRQEGIPLPYGAVYPEGLGLADGLSAEEYMRELLRRREQQQQQDQEPEVDDAEEDGEQQQDQQGESQDTDSGSGDSEGQGGDPGGAPGDSQEPPGGCRAEGGSNGVSNAPVGAHDGAGEDGAGGGGCGGSPAGPGVGPAESGSCSDGRQRPWELGEPTEDAPGLDESDEEQVIRRTARAAIERGTSPGSAKRWAEGVLDPPMDPAAKLLSLVRRYCDHTVGVGERSFRRPSRRSPDRRMCLPSNVAPMPRITLIVDTSGSMDARALGVSLGMIRKVIQSFRIRDGIRVITGDMRDNATALVMSDPRGVDLTGGGGTDMGALIEAAMKQRPAPQLVIVCTDGGTGWCEPPSCPVVVALTRKREHVYACFPLPDWATVVEMV